MPSGVTDAGNSTVEVSDATVLADDTTTALVTVTLIDDAAAPVVGNTVVLTATANGTGVTIGDASGVSDSNGQVTFTVQSDTVHPSGSETTFEAEDTDDTVTITETVDVEFFGELAVGVASLLFSAIRDVPLNDGHAVSVSVNGTPAFGTTATISITAGNDWFTVDGQSDEAEIDDTESFVVALGKGGKLNKALFGGGTISGNIQVAGPEGYAAVNIPVTVKVRPGGRRV